MNNLARVMALQQQLEDTVFALRELYGACCEIKAHTFGDEMQLVMQNAAETLDTVKDVQ